MPLLKGEVFIKKNVPPDLDPEEEVFWCKLTKEIFLDYEEYFERIILCNSLVWSCELTGRSGLTYQEAVEKEREAKKAVKTFPEYLKRPLIYLASLTKRDKLNDVCEDVYQYARERYFLGEEVKVTVDGNKLNCKIVGIFPPVLNAVVKIKPLVSISDAKEKASDNLEGKEKVKPFHPDPSLYKYQVSVLGNETENHVVSSESISRQNNVFSRVKTKLILKVLGETKNGKWKLKDQVIEKFRLSSMIFRDIFEGPLPNFLNITEKRQPNFKDDKKNHKLKDDKRDYKLEQKNSMKNKDIKKDKDGTPKLKKSSPNEAKVRKEKPKEDKSKETKNQDYMLIYEKEINDRLKAEEERRRKKEEEKQKRKEEKEKEKERLREERRIHAEYLREWLKPRDDLECDDLKDIPVPTPVSSSIPNELFGDVVMILEFFHTFSNILNVKDGFPQGLTLDHVEKALFENDINGPLADILQFLLLIIFVCQEEDDGNIIEDQEETGIFEVLEDDDFDQKLKRAFQAANVATSWPKKSQGVSLRNLTLDGFTLTEILRLHVLGLGGQTKLFNTDERQYERGGYTIKDDPSLQLWMNDVHLLKELSTKNIYDFTPENKLKIIKVLIDQLLTFIAIRDEIEEAVEKIRQIRYDLKHLQWADQRRERETSLKLRKIKEEKISGKTDSDSVENDSKNASNVDMNMSNQLPDVSSNSPGNMNEQKLAEMLAEENLIKEQETKKKTEFQKKEREFLDSLIKLQAGAIQPLGRDRAYRRYWLFNSIPGLFVEDDDPFVGTCLSHPTPYNPLSNPYLYSEQMLLNKWKENKHLNRDKENELGTNESLPTDCVSSVNKMHKLLSDNHPTMAAEKGKSINCCDKEVFDRALVTESKPNVFGMCTACPDECPVHGKHRQASRVYWSFYSSEEELESVINSLNPRGFRESRLRESLILNKKRIIASVSKCISYKQFLKEGEILSVSQKVRKSNRLNPTINYPPGSTMEHVMETNLRETLLELEEKIYCGSLGCLKAEDRNAWRLALENKTSNGQLNDVQCGGQHSEVLENHNEENGSISTEIEMESPHSRPVNNVVKELAAALLEIAQGIETKYINPPLGNSDELTKQKQRQTEKKIKKESGTNEADKSSEAAIKVSKSVYERWEESLMACTSFSQIFVHLATLDRSIAWSRSVLNANCRICRRKGDPEYMLLCDGCNRGHHMYCLKPALKEVPEGDWFCKDCCPPETKPIQRRRNTTVKSYIDDDEEEEDEEEQEDENEEEDGDEDGAYDSMNNDVSESEDDDESMDINDDICDVCERGGHLICCDTCPRAYHLGCVTPVLSRIPRGKWDCPKCLGRKQQRTTKIRIGVKRNVNKETPAEECPAKRTRSKDRDSASEHEFQSDFIGLRRSGPPVRRGASSDVPLDYKFCDFLLKEISRHESSWPFLRPVGRKQFPEYYEIIKRPTDLASMRQRLNDMDYRNTKEFLGEVLQLLQNCIMFNQPESAEYKAASCLNSFFEAKVRDLGYRNLPELLIKLGQSSSSAPSDTGNSSDLS